jgi:hypothetical protein
MRLQEPSGKGNPCPDMYHVPIRSEAERERTGFVITKYFDDLLLIYHHRFDEVIHDKRQTQLMG